MTEGPAPFAPPFEEAPVVGGGGGGGGGGPFVASAALEEVGVEVRELVALVLPLARAVAGWGNGDAVTVASAEGRDVDGRRCAADADGEAGIGGEGKAAGEPSPLPRFLGARAALLYEVA